MNCADCDSPLVCRYDDRHQCFTQWTTEPPTEPGWYWAAAVDGAGDEVDCILFATEVVRTTDGWLATPELTPLDVFADRKNITHWMRANPPAPPVPT